MSAAEALRALKIKTGSCRRLSKEVASYGQEAEGQQKRIDKLRAEGADEYTLKKQEEVKQESVDMIADVRTRLGKAVRDLEACVAENEGEAGVKGSEELEVAKAMVAQSKAVLSS